MKLSEVLNRFYVIPLGQSEIVGFEGDHDDPDLGEVITITWTDPEDGEEYRQEFTDQDIQIEGPIKGQFLVRQIDDEELVGFIALDGVDLEKVE